MTLVAGIAAVVAALKPAVRVVGVEPGGGAAKLTAALARGAPVALPGTASIADGLLPARSSPSPGRSFARWWGKPSG